MSGSWERRTWDVEGGLQDFTEIELDHVRGRPMLSLGDFYLDKAGRKCFCDSSAAVLTEEKIRELASALNDFADWVRDNTP